MSDIQQVREVTPYPSTVSVPPPLAPGTGDEATLPISHYLWVLKRHRWKIVAFVVLCVVSTYLVVRRLTPLYEATATIDIDRQMPTGAVGQDANTNVAQAGDADQFLATQEDIIRSDSVLRPVVEQLHLKEVDKQVAQALRTPEAENAPINLPSLDVSRPPNTYLLHVSYRSPDPKLAADVANAVANSYLRHSYEIRIDASQKLEGFMTKQLEALRAKMEASGQRLANFERDLNVINPDQKTSITSASLLQLNTDYNAAKEDRVRKEAAYDAIKSGSLDAAYTSTQADSLKRLSDALDDARQKFDQTKLLHGEAHPEYKAAKARVDMLQRQIDETRDSIVQRVAIEYRQALDRESMLGQQVAETRAEFDRLNAKSFDYQALKQEADADKRLYDELVNRINVAGINASFRDSAVRIADTARPPILPVYPRLKLSMAIAFIISGFLAIAAAVISDLIDSTIRDPDQVARTLRTQVLGTLPSVRSLRGRLSPLFGPAGHGEITPAVDKGISGYEEAIRTLRNSILLSDFDRRLRSLLITSASPAEGKSTVAAHLAAAHAEQRHKTLLIDGDLRRPSAHKFFGLSAESGLSLALAQGAPWRELIQRPEAFADLDVITAGPPSRRAADLIGRNLPDILEEASREYDLVVLDSPPLIGFPEPLQMAANVDGVAVVTRAGHTNRKAVAAVLGTLHRLRCNVLGLILNEVTREMSDSYYYYGYGYYTRYYRSESKSA